ncbi:PKD domain-containing protein [Bryobacter aggregatus]|uniref:PKD domain-containing protein n=1 Tax=Bryobacter aggregatus TaxID=360054 RepID=UPI003B509896
MALYGSFTKLTILFCCLSLEAGQGLKIGHGFSVATATIPNTGNYTSSAMASSEQQFALRLYDIVPPATGNPVNVMSVQVDTTYGTQWQIRLTAADTPADSDGPIGARLCFRTIVDDSPQGIFRCFLLGARTDVVLRAMRGRTSRLRSLEMWDTAGGGYITTPANWTLEGPLSTSVSAGHAVVFGGNPNSADTAWPVGTSAVIAWAKWTNAEVPLGAAAPKAGDSANMGNWLFDGNGTDQSGNLNLTVTSPTYVPTVDLPPASVPRTGGYQSIVTPKWTSWISLRAGYPNTLDATASSSDEIGSLSYRWRQVSGPTRLHFSDVTSATPTISGLITGTYRVQLQTTAPSAQISISDLQFGAVAMDENGVVVVTDPELDIIIGPQIAFGRSPWPYLDRTQQYMADFYGGLLGTDYADLWSSPATGKVSAVSGERTITGSGTNWQTAGYCGGNDYIVLFTSDADNLNGNDVGYYGIPIQSCASNTSLTVPFPMTAFSGLQYALMSGAAYGRWVGQNTNANYYDNVLAHYSFAARSGHTQYRDYARTLADRWISGPWLNYFRAGGTGTLNGAPRLRAMTGLVMRARDGRSNWWPALHTQMDLDKGLFDTPLPITSTSRDYDAREDWLRMSGLALASRYSTDGAKRSQYLATINSAITTWWAPLRGARGEWIMAYEQNWANAPVAIVSNGATGVTYAGGATGTVSTSGSSVVWQSGAKFGTQLVGSQIKINSALYTVLSVAGEDALTLTTSAGTQTGVGYQWGLLASTCSWPNRVWFTTTNFLVGGDARSYTCTYGAFDSMTLGSAYEGATGTKKFTSSATNGYFSQGFMQGIAAGAMWMVSKLTGNTTTATWLTETMDFVRDVAYRPASGGLYYVRTSIDCEPTLVAEANQSCIDQNGDGAGAQREYAAEVLGQGYGFARLISGASTYTTQGDIHAANLFGAPGYGGPGATGLSGYNLNSGLVEINKSAKYNGFYFGLGRAAVYPAARVGGAASAENRTVNVWVDPAAIAGAASVRVVLTYPSGKTKDATCDSAMMCSVTANATEGDHLLTREYWSGAGASGRLLAIASDPADVMLR